MSFWPGPQGVVGACQLLLVRLTSGYTSRASITTCTGRAAVVVRNGYDAVPPRYQTSTGSFTCRCGAVGARDRQVDRRDHLQPVGEPDTRRARLPRWNRGDRHRVDRLVEVIGPVEPAPPEPAEVLAQRVVHRAEEVGRGRMPERPASRVLAERLVEGRRVDHLVAEEVQPRRRLACSGARR